MRLLPLSRLGLAVVVVASFAYVPAAAAAPQQVVSGEAGTWGHVTLARPTTLDEEGGNPVGVTATKGRFAGFALYGAGSWTTYVTGRTDAPCAYPEAPAACPVAHVPDMVVYSATTGTLPAGRYRLVLLGEPGSRVTLRLRAGTVTQPKVRWDGRGQLSVRTGAPIGAADHHVWSDNDFVFVRGMTTIVGAVVRMDLDNATRADASFCARGDGQPQVPGGFVCEGKGAVSRNTIWSSGNGICAGCFPAAPAFTLTEVASNLVHGPTPEIHVVSRVAAERSRIAVTAFALTVPWR